MPVFFQKSRYFLNSVLRFIKGIFKNLGSGNYSASFYLYYFYMQSTLGFQKLGKRERVKYLANLTQKNVEKIDEKEKESIFEKEWNNLIILDACRADLFEEVTNIKSHRHSVASNTPEYIEKNFSENTFKDTIYVTGNPQFHDSRFLEFTGKKPKEVFHEIFQSYMYGLNSKKQTVDPEKVFKDAKTVCKLFPEKRKVIHFMPPHMPIIADIENSETYSWASAERKEIEKEELWKAYKENLKYILDYVVKLDNHLEGKTLVTSDHGNLFDSNGVYGHKSTLPISGLRKVPLTELNRIEDSYKTKSN